ncbi:hypothetical protein BH09PAT1_BH09PAT1_8890 [soil metagenome]
MKNKSFIDTLDLSSGQLNAYSTGLLQGTAYNRLMARLTSALTPFSLSVPEWKLLGQLYDNSEIRLSELAGLLSYDPPMVTKIVKSLEKKSLVKRTQDVKDERAKMLTINPKGISLIKEIEPEVKGALRDVLKGVSRDELMIYLKVLMLIVKNTDE